MNNSNYVFNSEYLINNFKELINRCGSLLEGKDEKDFNEVDLWINSFTHHLAVHQLHVDTFYPLAKSRGMFEMMQPQLDQNIMNSFIDILDRNAKSCFVTMCGFQVETILKWIAQIHNIKLNGRSMRNKFKNVLDYFEIVNDDKLNLIDIFYWTRNTLHNGGSVTRSATRSYKRHIFVFKTGNTITHATWDYLTYFVNEIIELLEEILRAKKYNN